MRPQRSTHRVVLEVGRDHVVAGLEQALDGQIQPVGAVVSEDPALGRFATKELIESVSRLIEHLFGRQGHPMSSAPGVCQTRSRESIHRLIDGFWFGKAGSGVIEVNHGPFQ